MKKSSFSYALFPGSEEEVWEQMFDKAKKMNYWINYATNTITYDEPAKPLAVELGMVGKRVKVYWTVQVILLSSLGISLFAAADLLLAGRASGTGDISHGFTAGNAVTAWSTTMEITSGWTLQQSAIECRYRRTTALGQW